jgi:hypothetical protein
VTVGSFQVLVLLQGVIDQAIELRVVEQRPEPGLDIGALEAGLTDIHELRCDWCNRAMIVGSNGT